MKMSLSNFFKSCGLNSNIEKAEYIPETLIDINPNKCFIIDVLPAVVSKDNGYKFEQIEKKIYSDLYKKFSKIVEKLWLYDDLFFYSELLHNPKMRRYIPLNKSSSYKRLVNSDKLINYKDIELLNILSSKDKIDLEYLQLYMTPTFNGIFVFINDNDKQGLIKNIINSENLFMRKID